MNKVPMKTLWQRTFVLFQSGWRQHILVIVPPLILSVLIYVAGNTFLHELMRGVRVSGKLNPLLWVVIGKTLAVRLPEFGLPWILMIIAYAALSANILAKSTIQHAGAISTSYASALARLGPLVKIGMFTFAAAVAGYAILAACASGIAFSSLIPGQDRYVVLEIILLGGFASWTGFLSRVALSVPLLIDKDNEARGAVNAMRWSIKISEGYELFFLLVVYQAFLLNIVGPWLGKLGLYYLWTRNSISSNSYVWLGHSVEALFLIAVETLIFVAFTGLYVELKEANKVVQGPECSEGNGAIPDSPR
jgi:hypothetical protein